jgi:predicted NBD/HSP70 family sugar kinase
MYLESGNAILFDRDNFISPKFGGYTEKSIVSDGEANILASVLRAKNATQAELTNMLPLSQQSISRMLTNLAKKGMLSNANFKNTGGRGQPSKAFTINSSYTYSIGVALRADGLTVVLSNFGCECIDNVSPEMLKMSRSNVIRELKSCISELLIRNNIAKEQIFGVGISTSGFHAGETDASYNTPEALNDFALINLDELFSKELGMPVWSENDGNAATIAENLCGVGNKVKNFAYFYFATGLGGGVVANGKLFRGVNGNAGEYRAILPLGEFQPPTMENLRVHLNESGSNFKSIHELISNYDDSMVGVSSWVKSVLPSLSLMVSATAALLDTQLIVFGGVVPSKLKSRMLTQLDFFDVNRRGIRRQTADVVASELKGDAAAIGASFLPFINKFYLI